MRRFILAIFIILAMLMAAGVAAQARPVAAGPVPAIHGVYVRPAYVAHPRGWVGPQLYGTYRPYGYYGWYGRPYYGGYWAYPYAYPMRAALRPRREALAVVGAPQHPTQNPENRVSVL